MGPGDNCVGRTDRVSEPREGSCASGRFLGEGNGGELCSGQAFWGAVQPQVSFQGCDVGAEAHILFYFLNLLYWSIASYGLHW